jgi:hypothetical protein
MAEITRAIGRRRPGFVPEWRTGTSGVDGAMTSILARYLRTIADRVDQAPFKHGLALLDTLGVRLIPARAARAPIVFTLSKAPDPSAPGMHEDDKPPDARIPAGTRVAAPPPPGSNDQITFEVEGATGVAVGRIQKVLSVWPGRDQSIDHTAAFLTRQPFRPFALDELEDALHALYIAHPTMLALSGRCRLDLAIELATPGSERLLIAWEFWDGKLWREFSRSQLDCDDGSDLGPTTDDGTAGFTRSGTLRLESDGGKSATKVIDGVESYWIRGRLDQPLPPDPARILPEIDRIRITTQIAHPIDFGIKHRVNAVWSVHDVDVHVVDESGADVPRLTVVAANASAAQETDARGIATVQGAVGVVAITLGDDRAEQTVPGPTGEVVTFTISPVGLKLDKAVADGLPVDVTKPFMPFGPQPRPGAAFYFTNEEAFSKPGARMEVFVQTSEPDPGPAPKTEFAPHTVSWEYWDGTDWRLLLPAAGGGADNWQPEDLSGAGVLRDAIVIPDDMAPIKVANQEARWMRIRLASGSYAYKQSVGTPGNTFEFWNPRPPILARILLGYTWPQGPYAPTKVVAHNDFEDIDRTEESRWPGGTYLPFMGMTGTPAIYLGLDWPLPVDRVGILFDIDEVRGEQGGPALQWSYWDGLAWQPMIADDETQHLTQTGIVSLIGQPDSARLARFDADLHWLRAALAEDGRPAFRTYHGIYLNAAWASQQLTVVDEPLGAGTGEPDQVLAFRQKPLLPGPEISIRELEGMRANVEWRILVRDAFPGDPTAVDRLEAMLGAEGTGTEVEWNRVRLVRDRMKRVREVWMPWVERPNLAFSGAGDRDFVVDLVRARLLFGDGVFGRVPPAGGPVMARRYRTGGGAAGNLPANTIKQLLAPLGGMESVTNPLPAEGGSDGERPEGLATRGPESIHHRGRAVTVADFATLALESSAAVGRAWALAATEPDGVRGAGWVTLVVVPRSPGAEPSPTFGLREEVRRFLLEHAPAGLAAGQRLLVTGPDYREVGVEASIVPINPTEAATVKAAALDALTAFLHPLTGGPDGLGWMPGQAVYLSDVATVLESCRGVDHVVELSLLLGETPQAGHAEVGAGRIAAAGALRLRMVEG